MANPFIGEIKTFAGSFAPVGWALCNGQELPIAENEVLFSLIGTTYGGDGQSTFALPHLGSRIPIHRSPNYPVGAMGGTETVSVNAPMLPMHNHSVQSNSAPGALSTSKGNFPAGCSIVAGSAVDMLYQDSADATMAAGSVTPTGSGYPHNNLQPFLVVTYIIATAGIYPPRG